MGDDVWNAANRTASKGSEFWDMTASPSSWDGPEDTPSLFVQSYTATDNTDGATATSQYYLTKHSPRETAHANPDTNDREDVTRPPGAPWGYSQNGDDISVYLENSYSWTAGVDLSTEIDVSVWKAKVLGIDLNLSFTYTVNHGISITAHSVPAGFGTYLEVFTVYTYHTGTVREWDQAGFVGISPYSIKVPNGSGIQYHYPYISLPNGPPPN